MKQYIIELDDTISEFLEFLASYWNKPTKNIIEDGLFNQISDLDDLLKNTFTVEED